MLADALAYVADVWVLGTYLTTVRGKPVRWFHWANAVGCFPLMWVEAVASAWPAFVVTAAFGLVGWIGVVRRDA